MNLRDQAFKATQTLLESFEDHELKNMNIHQLLQDEVEKGLIEAVLIRCQYNQVWAADILGIARNTLRKKINYLGLKSVRSKKIFEKF